jgi:hypothetical protein
MMRSRYAAGVVGRGEKDENMSCNWKVSLAALLAVSCAALAGCGSQPATLAAPEPDVALADQIRKSGGESSSSDPSAEETSATAEPVGWGNLKGRFVYDGPKPNPEEIDTSKDALCTKHPVFNETVTVGENGGLQNVVVYLASKKVPVNPDYEATADAKVRFDNHHCRFEPHILPIRTTQTLELHNSDPASHNSNISPLGDTPFNSLIGENATADYHFTKQQNLPVPVTCNIHPWMRGYILPRDNPYAAVTGEDGTFEIKNVPAGKWEFQVWQEAAGYLAAKPDWKKGKFKFEIKPGDNDLGEIHVSSDLVNK